MAFSVPAASLRRSNTQWLEHRSLIATREVSHYLHFKERVPWPQLWGLGIQAWVAAALMKEAGVSRPGLPLQTARHQSGFLRRLVSV